MDCVGKASFNHLDRGRVAGLVRSLYDPETFAAILKHLRHERKFFEPPILVE
jgi:hypothetical protein